MAVNVTFLGVTYSIPNTNGESGWGASLSAYLQALASGAATTSTVKQAIRTATSTPVTVVAATDYTVVTNLTVPGAVAVNLPAGVAKQVFVIVDGKGDAATNAITIDGNGAETINGAANYVINENYGGVILQFDGTGWFILAGFYGADPTFTSLTVTTLGVTGTATVGTLSATNATVGGANVTTVSNTQSFTNKTFDADGTGNSITNIENADIKTGAAIARSKLASGSNSHVVINDGSGVMSSEAQLATSRGGTGLGSIGTALQVLRVNSGATALEYASLLTGGDVVGPASSTDGRVALFDGATGKLLKVGPRLETDLVAGVASSVDSEIALFSGTGGKTIKRATGTGYAKVSSGVLQTPSATIPAEDIAGRTDGAAPATGRIGQVKRSYQGTTAFATTNVWYDATSLSLEAGEWDVTVQANVTRNAASSFDQWQLGISTTSGNSATGLTVGDNRADYPGATANNDQSGTVANYNVSISSTTTYYAKIRSVYGGTTNLPQYQCRLSARRVG